MWRKLAVAFAACAGMLMATTVRADGVMMNGVSARSISRGGTNLGFADNGGIIYDNPAAMVNIDGCGLFDIGADIVILSDHYADPDNNVYSTTATPLPQFGYIQKTGDGMFAYGVGVFTPAGFSEKYHMQGPFPLTGDHVYESFAALIKVLPAVACRLTERLSVGATLGVGICNANLEAPYILQGPGPLTGIPTALRTHGAGADLVWSVGMQYEWTDSTTIGATYQSAAPFRLLGNSDVRVPGLGTTSYESELNVEWPQSFGVGIKHCLCPHRAIAADIIWFDWSSSFDEVALSLHDPSNPFFPPQTTDHFPLNWRDTVSLRLGYEQELSNGVMFRLGYVYHRNPIPAATLTPFIQAFFEHEVSVGFGWQWWGWNVDLGYAHLFAPRQHVGTSAVIGGDFSNSTHDAMVDAIVFDLIKMW